MREILFKAKRKDNGEWVEGLLWKKKYKSNKIFISCFPDEDDNEEVYVVDESTICQFTGLTDKNGCRIWDNDIVTFKHEKFDFDDGLEPWKRTSLPNKKEYKRNYVVEFCNTPTHYGLRLRNGSIWFMVHKMTIVMHDVEVIGNTFDNPELMNTTETIGYADNGGLMSAT